MLDERRRKWGFMESAPLEVELKLEVMPKSLARLRRHPAFAGQDGNAGATQKLISVYYDTPDFLLRRKGLSLRLRMNGKGQKRIQTIKADQGRTAGLFERSEWERKVDGNHPDLSEVRGTALEPLLSAGIAARLKPVFETRIERTVVRRREDGSDIELTLDNGVIDTGDRSVLLTELELELKSGAPAKLFELAKKLGGAVPLRLSAMSKAARGYELLDSTTEGPVKANPLTIPQGTTSAAAFRLIGRSCLHQLVANEPLMSAGNPEALHQMRIGLRRFRAAVSVFSEIVVDDEIAVIKRELNWVGTLLGKARDIDVLIGEVLHPVRKEHRDEPGIGALVARSEQRRARAYRTAATAVGSARYRKVLLATAAWVEAGAWSTTGHEAAKARRERSIELFAPAELARRHKKVRKLGKHEDKLDVRGRHKFRIRIKKLRYATLFFSELITGKRNRKRCNAALDSMKRLQDALGELNDIAVRTRPSRDGSTHDRPFAAALLLRHQQARVQPLKNAASRAYDDFAAVKPFWT